MHTVISIISRPLLQHVCGGLFHLYNCLGTFELFGSYKNLRPANSVFTAQMISFEAHA